MRLVFGILGIVPNGPRVQSAWNTFFRDRTIDAFLDRYPTRPEQLTERLSEMFHHDRRGYIIGLSLQKAIIPLLDSLDARAAEEGSVDTVWNDGGVLRGFLLGDVGMEDRFALWTKGD